MKKVLRYIIGKTWRPYLKWYLSKPRHYRYDGLDLTVAPGVFHPGFFYSTKYLLEYLEGFDLKSRSVLELGCGSGLISLAAARRGARVTASDVNRTAVHALERNAQANRVDLRVVHADLFEGMPLTGFDYIIINPPYYPRVPRDEGQYAWYCGERYEYFARLFATVRGYTHPGTVVIMVLSEHCSVEHLRALAGQHGIGLEERARRQFLIESNSIYHVTFR